ncbi:hypothetical protein GQ54DRAFT_310819 [Martensiomyces pterosporus]|nr:hypothetical protein GQ54DRAFT_310819 [Martensiomyces pterosporus]
MTPSETTAETAVPSSSSLSALTMLSYTLQGTGTTTSHVETVSAFLPVTTREATSAASTPLATTTPTASSTSYSSTPILSTKGTATTLTTLRKPASTVESSAPSTAASRSPTSAQATKPGTATSEASAITSPTMIVTDTETPALSSTNYRTLSPQMSSSRFSVRSTPTASRLPTSKPRTTTDSATTDVTVPTDTTTTTSLASVDSATPAQSKAKYTKLLTQIVVVTGSSSNQAHSRAVVGTTATDHNDRNASDDVALATYTTYVDGSVHMVIHTMDASSTHTNAASPALSHPVCSTALLGFLVLICML